MDNIIKEKMENNSLHKETIIINNVLPTLPSINNPNTAVTNFIHSHKYFMNNYFSRLFYSLKNKKIVEIVSKNKQSEKLRRKNYETLLIRKLLDNNNVLYYYENKVQENQISDTDEFILILSDDNLLRRINDVSCISLGINSFSKNLIYILIINIFRIIIYNDISINVLIFL